MKAKNYFVIITVIAMDIKFGMTAYAFTHGDVSAVILAMTSFILGLALAESATNGEFRSLGETSGYGLYIAFFLGISTYFFGTFFDIVFGILGAIIGSFVCYAGKRIKNFIEFWRVYLFLFRLYLKNQ